MPEATINIDVDFPAALSPREKVAVIAGVGVTYGGNWQQLGEDLAAVALGDVIDEDADAVELRNTVRKGIERANEIINPGT